ncbi:hypothetical protein MATL_G00177790 [Megalops atlanticus]|uniref:Pyrin domain-containing protein n=1 Tax=Megalops atlanticus TaxID=7932 RepID=A0A9D3PQT9_MEGAT|nr:hypothetical protein MATL_G00177790 [Megalops atlanticus]
MNETKQVLRKRARSPVPSCQSMKSDRSMDEQHNFRREHTGDLRVLRKRAGSPVPSCLSMKSDRSMDEQRNFRGEATGDPRVLRKRAGSPVPSCQSMKCDRSMDEQYKFRGEHTGDPRVHIIQQSEDLSSDSSLIKKSLQETLRKLDENTLKQFMSHLSQGYPECFDNHLKDPLDIVWNVLMWVKHHQSEDYPECKRQQMVPDVMYIVEKMLENCGRAKSQEITLHILRNMNQNDLADSLLRDLNNEPLRRDQQKLKSNVKKKFECIFEGLAKQGHPTRLNEIYTELYITEGGSGSVNNEHEQQPVRSLLSASSGSQRLSEAVTSSEELQESITGQL